MSDEVSFLDYTKNPTAQDVEDKIRGANWWPQDEGQILLAKKESEKNVKAATERFLRLTGYRAFIYKGQPETRYFSVIDEGGIIRLGEGLLELQSLKIQGQTFTLNHNVFTLPENAQANGGPYTSLLLWTGNGVLNGYSLRHRHQFRPRSIEILGKWGQFLQWPADAAGAIVDFAAGITLSAVNQESELAGISEDEYSETYDLVGPIDQKTALKDWGRTFYEIASHYAKKGAGALTLCTAPSIEQFDRSYLPTP